MFQGTDEENLPIGLGKLNMPLAMNWAIGLKSPPALFHAIFGKAPGPMLNPMALGNIGAGIWA